MKNLTLTILGSAILTACATMQPEKGSLAESVSGPASGATSGSQSKSLFSKWKQDNVKTYVDLSGGSCGSAFYFKLITPNGAVCQCLLECPGGTTSGGGAIMSDCAYSDGSASPDADPGCHTLNAKYSYSNDGAMLSFTNLDTKVTTTFHDVDGQAAEAGGELAK